ncbi:tRNA (guanosine(37)-N1)-methyltransferase TrmD [bacterium]|nr:MAG: tRNA (guanosine(37)-N1)-methyltransferase TrmD [bacterium]
MRFDILTLSPEFFDSPFKPGVIGKAIEKGLIKVNALCIRDFTEDKHRTTDDSPYGGGAGMVMKPEPIVKALESLPKAGKRKVILVSPGGVPFTHEIAKELSGLDHAVIICGRYEGVDERVRAFVDYELSIGDYVLTGGEIPALAIIDAVGRLIPGVLGSDESKEDDSFATGLLEYPQYTRPEEFRGIRIPEVLLSGNHAEIARWRRRESIRRTLTIRPDILLNAPLGEEDIKFIEEISKNE